MSAEGPPDRGRVLTYGIRLAEVGGFKPGAGDAFAAWHMQQLLASLASQGVVFDPAIPAHHDLRRQVSDLAAWVAIPPAKMLLEDPASAELNRQLAQAAVALREALQAVEDHAAAAWRSPASDVIDTCGFVLPDSEAFEEARCFAIAIEGAALGASRHAQRRTAAGEKKKRGRAPLELYAEFIRRLHGIFVAATGELRGFKADAVENGAASGSFVELVAAAQVVLPKRFRAAQMTVGKRIQTALAEK